MVDDCESFTIKVNKKFGNWVLITLTMAISNSFLKNIKKKIQCH